MGREGAILVSGFLFNRLKRHYLPLFIALLAGVGFDFSDGAKDWPLEYIMKAQLFPARTIVTPST